MARRNATQIFNRRINAWTAYKQMNDAYVKQLAANQHTVRMGERVDDAAATREQELHKAAKWLFDYYLSVKDQRTY